MPEYEKTVLQMGTIVHLRVVGDLDEREAREALERGHRAFQTVEAACSRFDHDSELRRLCKHVNQPIPVTDILFHVLEFALAVAEETGGLFDPTVGRVLHGHGFQRHYLTGESVADEAGTAGDVTYRDVLLDLGNRTVTLLHPMTLDLGAVAKGFAIDLAANELRPYHHFLIDAGGDTYLGGFNASGEPWQVGIRHPSDTEGILCTLRASDVSICTSGGYERKSPVNQGTHHLIRPDTGQSPSQVVSSTVIAPFAMMADSFSTVVFLQGCNVGIQTLEQLGLDGLLVDDQLVLHQTSGLKEYLNE